MKLWPFRAHPSTRPPPEPPCGRGSSSLGRVLGLGLVIAASLGLGGVSSASTPKKKAKPTKHRSTGKQPEFPTDADQSRAFHIAALEPAACFAELEKRGIHFRKAAPSPGVRDPVRLLGPVGGVTYRTDFPDARRGEVPFEVFDCRLVVALAEFGPVLQAHDIDEVRIFSAWRPPVKGWPEGKLGEAHVGGLAADLRLFKKSDGTALDVEAEFHGRIGAIPCGQAAIAPSPDTPAARELRAIYCAAADARLFHVLLSPNFDAPHRNHFHVEVRPEVRWFIVR